MIETLKGMLNRWRLRQALRLIDRHEAALREALNLRGKHFSKNPQKGRKRKERANGA